MNMNQEICQFERRENLVATALSGSSEQNPQEQWMEAALNIFREGAAAFLDQRGQPLQVIETSQRSPPKASKEDWRFSPSFTDQIESSRTLLSNFSDSIPTLWQSLASPERTRAERFAFLVALIEIHSPSLVGSQFLITPLQVEYAQRLLQNPEEPRLQIVAMQTGEGKTLASMLAILEILATSNSQVRVVVPTDSLVPEFFSQIHPWFQLLGLDFEDEGNETAIPSLTALYLQTERNRPASSSHSRRQSDTTVTQLQGNNKTSHQLGPNEYLALYHAVYGSQFRVLICSAATAVHSQLNSMSEGIKDSDKSEVTDIDEDAIEADRADIGTEAVNGDPTVWFVDEAHRVVDQNFALASAGNPSAADHQVVAMIGLVYEICEETLAFFKGQVEEQNSTGGGLATVEERVLTYLRKQDCFAPSEDFLDSVKHRLDQTISELVEKRKNVAHNLIVLNASLIQGFHELFASDRSSGYIELLKLMLEPLLLERGSSLGGFSANTFDWFINCLSDSNTEWMQNCFEHAAKVAQGNLETSPNESSPLSDLEQVFLIILILLISKNRQWLIISSSVRLRSLGSLADPSTEELFTSLLNVLRGGGSSFQHQAKLALTAQNLNDLLTHQFLLPDLLEPDSDIISELYWLIFEYIQIALGQHSQGATYLVKDDRILPLDIFEASHTPGVTYQAWLDILLKLSEGQPVSPLDYSSSGTHTLRETGLQYLLGLVEEGHRVVGLSATPLSDVFIRFNVFSDPSLLFQQEQRSFLAAANNDQQACKLAVKTAASFCQSELTSSCQLVIVVEGELITDMKTQLEIQGLRVLLVDALTPATSLMQDDNTRHTQSPFVVLASRTITHGVNLAATLAPGKQLVLIHLGEVGRDDLERQLQGRVDRRGSSQLPGLYFQIYPNGGTIATRRRSHYVDAPLTRGGSKRALSRLRRWLEKARQGANNHRDFLTTISLSFERAVFEELRATILPLSLLSAIAGTHKTLLSKLQPGVSMLAKPPTDSSSTEEDIAFTETAFSLSPGQTAVILCDINNTMMNQIIDSPDPSSLDLSFYQFREEVGIQVVTNTHEQSSSEIGIQNPDHRLLVMICDSSSRVDRLLECLDQAMNVSGLPRSFEFLAQVALYNLYFPSFLSRCQEVASLIGRQQLDDKHYFDKLIGSFHQFVFEVWNEYIRLERYQNIFSRPELIQATFRFFLHEKLQVVLPIWITQMVIEKRFGIPF